jgi:DNA polymerase II small subunit
MADENTVTELVRILSNSKIVLSGDIDAKALKGIDTDLLASKIIESKRDSTAMLNVVLAEDVRSIIETLKRVEKAPMPIEVIRSSDFKPLAAETDASYKISNRPNDRAGGTATDFVNYFNNRLQKIRSLLEAHKSFGLLPNLDSLKGVTSGREISVVGMVTNKFVTKKGNVMAIIEDDTGNAKIMFMGGSSQQSRELTEKSNGIINDEVIAVKGKVSGPFVIASEIVWPDVPIKEKKVVADDVAVAFLSDIHVGSKRFMQKNFYNMIQWLNGNVNTNKELAGKIKYVVIGGDVADGIGVYPGQENDLAIFDIYTQYSELFNFIDAMPDYIHVFLIPGNHDAVQRAEPQPPLGSDIIRDFNRPNVHILSNPSYITLHGLDVLTYHGTSLDSMISAIPGSSYANPEKVMVEILKRRHLSPIYGGNVIVPSKEDNLVIDKIPDILHMGHIHKNGITSYHGVEIVNSGTWQARTDFQIRQGHIPTPCILPVYEMKSRVFSSINFSGEQS